ncbi:interleukin-36 gamma [Castor canadensis]|uniref:Interleukin-1 n=1 Tax=Castor canadensis TaxID=51338 RepID=A0A8B7THT4_CASCN|nr:interleukin-36 gamma-like [Castor canadensis]
MNNVVEKTIFGAHNPETGRISDLDQLVWLLQDQTLMTVPLTDSVKSVTITVIPSKYPESLEQDKGNPIYMGIKSPDMCLFCESIKGQPMLKLKEGNVLDLYNQAELVKPFLFYHIMTGSTSTFESVAFPGSFIASSKKGKPIVLTSDQGKHYNTNFHLDLKN